MKKILLIFLIFCSIKISAQKLDFDKSNVTIKEGKENVIEVVKFSIKTDKDSVEISVKDDENGAATKGKDYTVEKEGKVWLCKANKHQAQIKITVLADEFFEYSEEGSISFTYISPADSSKVEQQVTFSITNAADGGADKPIYTSGEAARVKGIAFEMYTGGNFDFFEALKFKNVGGEIFIDANSISPGKKRLVGFTAGAFNFNTLSYDSSNGRVTTRFTNLDPTGKLRTDTSLIALKTTIDHNKTSSSIWGYYFNPTWRLNQHYSDFFNWYISGEMELLSITTKYETDEEVFKKDTFKYNPIRLPAPVFSEDMIPVKTFRKNTNVFIGLGLPMYLNAEDKVKFFFQPSGGFTRYKFSNREIDVVSRKMLEVYYTEVRPYMHFKFRASEQYTGLRITIGGEIRQIAKTDPLVNLYLGLKVDLAKWFKK